MEKWTMEMSGNSKERNPEWSMNEREDGQIH